MKLNGNLLIGAQEVSATTGTMKALNPAANVEIEPLFAFGGSEEVDRAVQLADDAFDSYNRTSLPERAAFLERIADGLDAITPELAQRASLETGLPVAQLEGEAAKSATQFRQFATVVRQGRFRQAAIDPAQPERQPRARMDHRMQKIALGPVAIFGASNFPISYSVAGGDTASALAAGCPVILKAHNGHPGASELMGRVIQQAVRDSGLHEGVFSLVRGGGNGIGEALVDHPLIKGVTFTGSEGGGMALFRRAQQRPDPIPVFTEMTSVNPTFVLPAALAARGGAIGDGFTERMLVTVGQACLKPAILLAVDGPGYLELKNAMVSRVEAMQARTMLTPGINAAYRKNVERQSNAGAEANRSRRRTARRVGRSISSLRGRRRTHARESVVVGRGFRACCTPGASEGRGANDCHREAVSRPALGHDADRFRRSRARCPPAAHSRASHWTHRRQCVCASARGVIRIDSRRPVSRDVG